MSEEKKDEVVESGVLTADEFVNQLGELTGPRKVSEEDVIASFLADKSDSGSSSVPQVPEELQLKLQQLEARNQQLSQALSSVNKQRMQPKEEPDFESLGIDEHSRKALDAYLGHNLQEYKAEVQKIQHAMATNLRQQREMQEREMLESDIRRQLKANELPEEVADIASMFARDRGIDASQAVDLTRRVLKASHNKLRKKALDRRSAMPFIPGELKDGQGNIMSPNDSIEVNGIGDRAKILRALINSSR